MQPVVDWGFVGVAVSVLFGLLSVAGLGVAVAGFARDHPPRRLEYITHRLFGDGTPADGEPPPANVPQFTQFALVSRSRADIPRTTFDGGESLIVRVTPADTLAADPSIEGQIRARVVTAHSDYTEFEVAPQLIRRDAMLSLLVHTRERPVFAIRNPLIDIRVWDVTERGSRWWSAVVIANLTFALVAAALLAYELITLAAEGRGLALPHAITLIAVTAALTALGLFFVVRLGRWRRTADRW
jgi:hypothetical protein